MVGACDKCGEEGRLIESYDGPDIFVCYTCSGDEGLVAVRRAVQQENEIAEMYRKLGQLYG